ncbi:MAG: hypothetical protein NTU83_05160, partial [Candidatus Hydrogenedentes bacterium]|nr:hypothetical protein [Candidatus Hydrogenedentota bacterium]
GLDGMGQYGISYSGSDNPEDNYSVSGDCNIDGMWSSYNQSMRWMVWMSVIVIVLDPIVAMFPA